MAIVPQGLFDQLYGIDLGDMGAPVEPAIPGNPLPPFINSEYPTQIPASLAIPPEVVDAAEIVNTDDDPSNQPEVPIIIEEPSEGDQGGGWPDDDFWANAGSIPLPDPNPARQERMSDVQNAGNTQAAINSDELEEPEYSDRVSEWAGGIAPLGFDQNYVDAALDAIARNPGADPSLSSDVFGGLSSGQISTQGQPVDDTIGDITGLMNDPVDMAMSGGIQSPQSSQVASHAPLSSDPASPENQALGGMIISDLANRSTDSELNARANAALNAAGAGSMTADQLAGGFSGISPAASPGYQEPEPTIDVPTIPGSITVASASPIGGLSGGQAAAVPDYSMGGLAQALGGQPMSQVQGAYEEAPLQQSQNIVAPAPVPAVNPNNNVGGFASRGLGVGLANQQASAASDRADRAEADANAARAENVRSAGYAPGLADALSTRGQATTNRGVASLGDTTDRSSSLSLPGLDSKLGLSPMTMDRGVGAFASDLFGGINKSKAESFNNPAISLHELSGQELAKDSYNPYEGTNFAPLGSQVQSFDNTNPLSRDDLLAEIDAMNLAGNMNPVNMNSYNMHAEPYGQSSPQSAITNASYGDDEEEDDDNEVGGFTSSGRSSGIDGISLGSIASDLGYQGSAEAPGPGGFTSSINNSPDGFGGTDFADAQPFGSFSGGNEVGGFTSNFGDVGGFGGNDNGGVGGDNSFGGFADDTTGGLSGGSTSGVGGSPGSQSDDTGIGAGNSQGNDGGFDGFTGFDDVFGSDSGFGGFT